MSEDANLRVPIEASVRSQPTQDHQVGIPQSYGMSKRSLSE